MHSFEYILIMLGAVLLSNLISQQFPRLSTPLVQVGIGIALTLLPISFEVTFDPELFLVLFIAPLLFEDAKKADKPALWRLRRPILLLALGLVFATTFIAGFFIRWFTGVIPLAAAIALAAALAPTDAVAVASLRETATISDEQDHLLKGEALLNDASSIVAFQFALAAVLTGSYPLFDAGLTFLFMFLGGLVVGFGLMLLRALLVRWLHASGIESITFHVLFEAITPFLVFLIAEALHVSGIIAVVAAGIAYAFSPRQSSPRAARHNIVSTSVWSVISYSLNGLVFLILGTQLPYVIQRVWSTSPAADNRLIVFIVLILLAILLLRFVWVLVMHRNVNLAAGSVGGVVSSSAAAKDAEGDAVTFAEAGAEASFAEGRASSSRREQSRREQSRKEQSRKEQRAARRRAFANEKALAHADPRYWPLHLRDALLLSLTGAKGAITLAVVLTIPLTLSDRTPFPDRDLIIFLASGVILLSLLLANFLIPLIAPKKAEVPQPEYEITAILDIYRLVIRRLVDDMKPNERVATEEVAQRYYARIGAFKDGNQLANEQDAEVRRRVIEWEREYTRELVSQGKVSAVAGIFYLDQLSRTLARVQHHSAISWELTGFFEQAASRFRTARQRRKELRREFRGREKRGHDAVGSRAVRAGAVGASGPGVSGLGAEGSGVSEPGTEGSRAEGAKKLNRRAIRSEIRELMVANYLNAQKRLEEYAQEPEAPVRVIELIRIGLERRIARLRGPQDFLVGARGGDKDQFLEVEARALDFEREAINEALRANRISYDTAKKMRDNVAMMELDIEGQLE
jgi:CPA1 family monovalent cation:H+ antiporter